MEHQHGHQHGPHQPDGSGALAELLDLDGEVQHAYLSDVTAWLHGLAAGRPCHRVLDLGAGTGTGTIALARRFAGADVIAVDQSDELLARVRAKALDLGLAGRVGTVRADLGAAWPAIEAADLAWASNLLHELADPGRVLTDVFAAIRPGGLLAVAEMDAPPRFLPDDLGLGRPGLESRCHAALEPEQAARETEADALETEQADLETEAAGSAPRHGADWGPRLEEAGFGLVARRTFIIDLKPPLPAGTGRYARAYLRRIRPVLEGRLDAGDLAALDTLIDSDGPDGLLRRRDLSVRSTRTAWIVRRAAT
jgi:SAM-dependent methyltransferase